MPSLSETTTAIVKTFRRPAALRRLVLSLRKAFPTLPILICDDGDMPPDDVAQWPGPLTYYQMEEFDIGCSAGRNFLLEQVTTPYVLCLDDDLELQDGQEEGIQQLYYGVSGGWTDVAGGHFIEPTHGGRHLYYHGLFVREDKTLRMVRSCRDFDRDKQQWQRIRWEAVDICHQFFVANTDVLRRAGGWEPALKTEEHEDFFLNLQQHGVRVWNVPEAAITHWNDRPAGYKEFRKRDYRPQVLEKWDLDCIDFFGERFYYRNGEHRWHG